MRVVSTLAGCLCFSGLVFGQGMEQKPFRGRRDSLRSAGRRQPALTLSRSDRGQVQPGRGAGQQGHARRRRHACGRPAPCSPTSTFASRSCRSRSIWRRWASPAFRHSSDPRPFNVVDARANGDFSGAGSGGRYGTQARAAGVKRANLPSKTPGMCGSGGGEPLPAGRRRQLASRPCALSSPPRGSLQRAADMRIAAWCRPSTCFAPRSRCRPAAAADLLTRNEVREAELELARPSGWLWGSSSSCGG